MAFTLEPDHWYGWQLIPGYTGERVVPHFSPIRVHTVAQAARSRLITIEYTNVLYAAGVQVFRQALGVLRRGAGLLGRRYLHEHS
jgi:hypothetical protein